MRARKITCSHNVCIAVWSVLDLAWWLNEEELRTYVVAVLSVQVEWLNEVNMWISNNSCIVEMVLSVRVGKEAVGNKYVACLRNNAGELVALGNVLVEYTLERSVQAFRMIVKILANPCVCIR